MLRNFDNRLNADVIRCLRAMGHGDDLIICDTNFPDIGLHTFAARGPAEDGLLLCLSEASSVGSHWAGPFPYNDGPVKVYAPQHTHPHPRFSPDGRWVVFTSDRSGHAQVYECEMIT